jgi:hypothetical protein
MKRKRMPKPVTVERPIVALACTRCNATVEGRGCRACGCPEYQLIRDQQRRLFDK